MFDNIPDDMKQRKQWVLWKKEVRGGKETKVPYTRSNQHASVGDPSTYMDFTEASTSMGWTYNGIGFVLTDDDPYTVIDYDERCPQEVIDSFDTYIEMSQSGRGVHIVMKGTFDGRCRRKDPDVECYKSGRYIIMTGNVVKNMPVNDQQQQLNVWRKQVGLLEEPAETPNTTRTMPDIPQDTMDDVLDRMFNSGNGDKLRDYYENGHPVGSDNSAIDASLLEGLRFYSGGNQQMSFELFSRSACMREKWNRKDYRDRTWRSVNRGDVWEPLITSNDYVEVGDDFCKSLPMLSNVDGDAAPDNVWTDSGMPKLREDQYAPAGLGILSDISEFYIDTAPAPKKEFAMHTALACIGTYIARRFATESGNYSSLYWGIIGPTGCGKGHSARVIEKIIIDLDKDYIDLLQGSGYTSDAAIFSALQRAPAHMSFIDEFGDYMSNSRSSSNTVGASQWRILKEAWANGGVLRPKNYSDHTNGKSNATKHCHCPCITLFGNSTIEQFWESLNVSDSADGFLNRWLIYTDESKPVRAPMIKDLWSAQIPSNIHKWHEQLTERAPMHMSVCGDDDAKAFIGEDPGTRPSPTVIKWGEGVNKIWIEYAEVIDEMWGRQEFVMFQRAVQMAMSISLVVELAKNPKAEFITKSSAAFAVEYVHTCISQMAKYTKRNLAGSDEEKLANTLLNVLRKAGEDGCNIGEFYKKKLSGGERKKIAEALTRLTEAGVITCINKFKRPGRKGRPSKTWFAIESE